MRKRLPALALCFCAVAAMMMTGCGGAPQSSSLDGGAAVGREQAPGEAPEPPEAEPEQPAGDWFSRHGLTITPQGDFTFSTMAYDADNQDMGTFPVRSNAVVTETTDGVEPGYKQVTAVFTNDYSVIVPGSVGSRGWQSAFDRYTGTSFEFDAAAIDTIPGLAGQREGAVTIVNGEESYDISVAFESANDLPTVTHTITVTCPADYDGAVFQIGYGDAFMRERNSRIDYGARLYTIDELPYFGNGYYYFSYSDE